MGYYKPGQDTRIVCMNCYKGHIVMIGHFYGVCNQCRQDFKVLGNDEIDYY